MKQSSQYSDETLLNLVEARDVEAVRLYFEQAFWDKAGAEVKARHIISALMGENMPMTRLLISRGDVKADDAELVSFLATTKVSGPISFKEMLKKCGLTIQMSEKEPVAEPAEIVKSVTRSFQPSAAPVPTEWQHVLAAFHKKGAIEAVIAGGALRDYFNNKAVKDVDIFLKMQGSEKKHYKLLKRVFASAGLDIVAQDTGGPGSLREKFPAPQKGALTKNMVMNYHKINRECPLESWTVTAGPNRTNYNIIFTGEKLYVSTAAQFGENVIAFFDYGLCQIAFDGKKIITTSQYKVDTENKKITLIKGNVSSVEHLTRIMEKYPDFALCRNAQKILSNETVSRPPFKSVVKKTGPVQYDGF